VFGIGRDFLLSCVFSRLCSVNIKERSSSSAWRSSWRRRRRRKESVGIWEKREYCQSVLLKVVSLLPLLLYRRNDRHVRCRTRAADSQSCHCSSISKWENRNSQIPAIFKLRVQCGSGNGIPVSQNTLSTLHRHRKWLTQAATASTRSISENLAINSPPTRSIGELHESRWWSLTIWGSSSWGHWGFRLRSRGERTDFETWLVANF
jgi:hypothetical protein